MSSPLIGDRKTVRRDLLPLACGLIAVALFSHVAISAPVQPYELLVFHSGQVVRGAVTASNLGFTVELSTGSSLFVPAQQVWFRSASLEDAYSKMRDELPENTAASHIALARWCVTYKLFEQARDELETALRLEPDRRETKSLLRRVNDLLNPDLPPLISEKEPAKRFTLADIDFERTESLAGLSRDTASQFTRRIQPILMNNCSTASCHGPASKTEFRLNIVRVSTGTNRHLVEKNLATVLEYVDLNNPRASMILTEITRNHGVRGRTLFRGAKGSEQLEELTAWISALAEERGSIDLLATNDDRLTATDAPTLTANTQNIPDSTIPLPEESLHIPATAPNAERLEPTAISARPRSGNPSPTRSRTSRPQPGVRDHADVSDRAETRLEEELPDPFDPEIFNRETRNRERVKSRF